MNSKNKPIFLLPIIVALGFIPMIVRAHTYSSGLSQFDWFPDASEWQTDFFLWYKMVAIIIVAAVMCGLFIYCYLKNGKKWLKGDYAWYLLAGYAVLALFSALFSPYREFTFKGSYEVFESIWVILGYVIMCYYTYQMLQTEDDARFVAKYAGIGILIVTLIGFFQYLGFDLFRTTFGKKLITPTSMWSGLDELSFTFPLRTSYTTLYNTNYLAFYYGLLIPILIVLFLFSKKLTERVIYAVLAVLCFATMVGSNSKSALLALGITFVLGCVVLHRYLKKYFWIPLLALAGFVLIVVLYANRLGGFENLYRAIFVGVEADSDSYAIKDINTLDDEIVFDLGEKQLHLSYELADDGNIYVYMKDKDGNLLPYQLYETTFMLDDPNYAGCAVTPVYLDEEHLGLQVLMDEKIWYFAKLEDGTYYYCNAIGKYTKIPDVQKSALLSNSLYSGRGMLWNYVIPKLKSCLILGKGSNTFLFVYPQDNYVYKKYANTEGLFDVKAHSFYFQQMIENGILALLLLLAFYAWYLIRSIKLYMKTREFTFASMLGLGIALGTFDYMIIGIANDSNVNTAPVFWVLLGAGMAMNHMVEKRDEK